MKPPYFHHKRKIYNGIHRVVSIDFVGRLPMYDEYARIIKYQIPRIFWSPGGISDEITKAINDVFGKGESDAK